MKVIKRSGKLQEVNYDKITQKIKRLANLNPTLTSVDGNEVSKRVISGFYDKMTTVEIDELAAETAATMCIKHPEYSQLAARITVDNLHKTTEDTFLQAMQRLIDHVNKDLKTPAPLISEHLLRQAIKFNDEINEIIDQCQHDYSYDYFGIRTLMRSYLLSNSNEQIIERPQYMLMRVALSLYSDWDSIKRTYELLRDGYYTHATPTLFNAGTNNPQLSSCFLLANESDSIDGFFNTIHDAASISKWAGGIGISIHNARANGSYIRGTGGQSSGIVPMLRTYNDVARWVDQCFTEDTMIYTDSGVKQMKDLKAQDLILSEDGKYCPIKGVLSYEQKGQITQIKAKGTLQPIKVTNQHPIKAIRNTYKRDSIEVSLTMNQLDKGIVSPQWIDAEKLTTRDWIGKAIPQVIRDQDVDREDMYVYGLLIGDGHFTKNEVGISFNNETNLESIERLKIYLMSRGIHFWICEDEEHKVLQVRWSNSDRFKFNREDIYVGDSKAKKIDVKYTHLPLDKSIHLLKGLLDSDGHITASNEVTFYSVYPELIEDVRYLILRFGIPTSGIWIKKDNSRLRGNVKPSSILCTLRIPRFDQLADHLNLPRMRAKHWIVWDKTLYTRITEKTNVEYDGIVYDLKVESPASPSYTLTEATVHNGGKRKGSFAIYLEPWHADVFDFLDLKKNHGKEEMRARDLFYALWIPDLFMQRVEENRAWTLMCPFECPGLDEVHGQEFNELYMKYEIEGRGKKTIEARQLWNKILESQIETGTPYMLYKDAANKKSNQKNLGTIKSSNLCTEIIEYSDKDETAVCNLASIAVNKFFTDGRVDYDKLHDVTYHVTKALNRVIDFNFYPTEKAQRSNKRHRPIGIGIQGLADLFFDMKIAFDSDQARFTNELLFETIYHAALCASLDLAKSDGAYSSFEQSPTSQGILQYDLWEETLDVESRKRYDWKTLKQQIIKHGLRNSLLLAPMPTASTAQILGNNECFEPITSNLYTRRVLSGEFIVINKHLVKDLIELDLWNDQMINKLKTHNGSVQNIEEIPQRIRQIYKTSFEISQKSIIDMAADRGKFIDQSQSMNIFMEKANFAKLTSMHFYGWKKGLKTGMYYLRTKAATNAIQFTVDKQEDKNDQVSCSIDNQDDCEMCGS